MQANEFDDFKQFMADQCTAYNRPFSDDVVRVFWDALKGQSLRYLRQRASLHQSTKNKFPTPADLLPSPEKQRSTKPQEQSMLSQLEEWILQHRSLTPQQIRSPWTPIHRGSVHGVGFEIIGVDIPQCDAPSGYRVMVEDMQLSDAA